MESQVLIKKCANDSCDAIFHNVPRKHTLCFDCEFSGALITINKETYWKWRWIHFQYDFEVAKLAYENNEIADFHYPEIIINNQTRLDI